jgi:two-component system OmpR family sensor kinase
VVAVLVALLAIMMVAVGVSSELALQHFLVGRLDQQLVAAGDRSVDADDAQAPDGGGGPSDGSAESGPAQHGAKPNTDDTDDTGARFLLAPGQSAGTLGARIANGRVTAAGVLTDAGGLQPLRGEQDAALIRLPVDGRPHTATIDDRGDFRMLAARASDGDVLITGLPLKPVDATLWHVAAAEAALAGAALVVAAALGVAMLRRTLRPLRRLAATATRVSTLPLRRGEVALSERVAAADTDPRTEVGQVGVALNRLLDHVTDALTARQSSESRVRQFVADASHELRTPLSAIRGYAEVTRRSQEEAPPDLAYAMARVESEATRMTTLVEDLLLLARLDEGRPLAVETVDLSRLVVDLVSDAAAAGRDHRWELDLPENPITVEGDPARLHQVLANLLANARTHTPVGTTVTTGLERDDAGAVTLTVCDEGPGIPPDVQPRVFERFARGDDSRSHRGGHASSTGLGLAIVAAIVHAHGGTVNVTSRPGQTVFRVHLRPECAEVEGRAQGGEPPFTEC